MNLLLPFLLLVFLCGCSWHRPASDEATRKAQEYKPGDLDQK